MILKFNEHNLLHLKVEIHRFLSSFLRINWSRKIKKLHLHDLKIHSDYSSKISSFFESISFCFSDPLDSWIWLHFHLLLCSKNRINLTLNLKALSPQLPVYREQLHWYTVPPCEVLDMNLCWISGNIFQNNSWTEIY